MKMFKYVTEPALPPTKEIVDLKLLELVFQAWQLCDPCWEAYRPEVGGLASQDDVSTLVQFGREYSRYCAACFPDALPKLEDYSAKSNPILSVMPKFMEAGPPDYLARCYVPFFDTSPEGCNSLVCMMGAASGLDVIDGAVVLFVNGEYKRAMQFLASAAVHIADLYKLSVVTSANLSESERRRRLAKHGGASKADYLRPIRTSVLSLYGERTWNSRRQAALRLAPHAIDLAKKLDLALSADNVVNTISKWIREAKDPRTDSSAANDENEA
jgi:hypothetical protein